MRLRGALLRAIAGHVVWSVVLDNRRESIADGLNLLLEVVHPSFVLAAAQSIGEGLEYGCVVVGQSRFKTERLLELFVLVFQLLDFGFQLLDDLVVDRSHVVGLVVGLAVCTVEHARVSSISAT
jgi:hypothetical protein